jgi:tetratricopeptide (TPR) repeat protein
MHAVRFCALALLCVGVINAQSDGTSDVALAYKLLSTKDYDGAIAAFRRGLRAQPKAPNVHKDLAYTLLKAGESTAARDEFKAALDLDPHDETSALEYAFLCYETKKEVEARRVFGRLRQYGVTSSTRDTASKAFESIDQPLAEGIDRWKKSIAKLSNPLGVSSFSAHWELAQLAERRDDLPLASEQYEICRKLKPDLSSLLVDLSRIWRQMNEVEQAHAALLAASRGADPRTAEDALELLGRRYPYAYEFQNAIQLDPRNVTLRRELAYLYLALGKEPEAVQEFQKLLKIAPGDKLSLAQLEALRPAAKNPAPVLPANRSEIRIDPRAMGLKSLAAGYTNDAIRYLRIAHENAPDDAEIMLQLGWAYNLAKNDTEAIHWFEAARHSTNRSIARDADKAWHNLLGSSPAQTAMWLLPMYSSRWNDSFVYGQLKRNLPFGTKLPVHFYLSGRFIGDVRGQVNLQPVRAQVGSLPGYLSENSIIPGIGASSRQWHHLLGWAEAGISISYLPGRQDVGAAIPDYRGGLNFARGFGSLLGNTRPGLFYETTADAVYVSRFDKDWLFYSQHRLGRTFHAFGGDYLQTYVNGNVTQDVKREFWANSVEFGPGARVHLPGTRPGVYLSADWLRGAYTMHVNDDFHRPNYNDLRLGFWYAAAR